VYSPTRVRLGTGSGWGLGHKCLAHFISPPCDMTAPHLLFSALPKLAWSLPALSSLHETSVLFCNVIKRHGWMRLTLPATSIVTHDHYVIKQVCEKKIPHLIWDNTFWHRDLKSKEKHPYICEQIKLPAKLIDCFLWSNKSNISQIFKWYSLKRFDNLESCKRNFASFEFPADFSTKETCEKRCTGKLSAAN